MCVAPPCFLLAWLPCVGCQRSVYCSCSWPCALVSILDDVQRVAVQACANRGGYGGGTAGGTLLAQLPTASYHAKPATVFIVVPTRASAHASRAHTPLVATLSQFDVPTMVAPNVALCVWILSWGSWRGHVVVADGSGRPRWQAPVVKVAGCGLGIVKLCGPVRRIVKRLSCEGKRVTGQRHVAHVLLVAIRTKPTARRHRQFHGSSVAPCDGRCNDDGVPGTCLQHYRRLPNGGVCSLLAIKGCQRGRATPHAHGNSGSNTTALVQY